MILKIKRYFLILFIFTLFLNSFPLSQGISVSPGSISMDFVPNYVFEGTANFGTGGRTNHIAVSSSGSGFDITIDKTELFCDREPCRVNYTITMPESFDTPGVHKGNIRAKEVFNQGQAASISAVASVGMQVYIRVPYPGKYLEFRSLEAESREAGESIPFKAILISRGKEIINSARGTVYIYDRNNKEIDTIHTNTISDIEPQEKVNLFVDWDSGPYEKGRYHALMVVNYDGFKVNKTVEFKLGGLDVELINYTREVIKEGIKPFIVEAESIWSESIPNLKARVGVLNKQSKEITFFETLTVNIKPWKSAELRGFLDTGKLNLSDYNVNITLFFENSTKSYDGTISIIEEVPEKKKKSFSTIQIVLGVLIVLLIVMLIFLVYYIIIKPNKERFKKNKDKKKKHGGKEK